jgi:hypothetical protein
VQGKERVAAVLSTPGEEACAYLGLSPTRRNCGAGATNIERHSERRYRTTFFGAKPPINEIVSQREHSQYPAISDEPHWLRSNRAFNLHVSCSSLRRVPEMPHSISAKFQSVSQRIASDPAHRARRHRVDPVLFLPYAACVQSVEFDGLEAIRNLRTSLSSRLRLTGRSMGCDPRLATSRKLGVARVFLGIQQQEVRVISVL